MWGKEMAQSKAQVRLAYAVKGGKTDKIPRGVADEIIADAKSKGYNSLPERKLYDQIDRKRRMS